MADNAARERRLQRLKDERRQELPKVIAKRVAIGVIALAVIGGLGAAIYFAGGPGDEDCPGHWHSNFAVFVDGERARIPQPPYMFQNDGPGGIMPLSLHLHSGNTQQIHYEPQGGRRCVGVEETMGDMGITLESDRIAFSDEYDGLPVSGSHEANETHMVRILFQQNTDDGFREMSFSEADDYQPRDGEKFVIAFGDYSDEELQAMMDAIPWPTGFQPQSHDG